MVNQGMVAFSYIFSSFSSAITNRLEMFWQETKLMKRFVSVNRRIAAKLLITVLLSIYFILITKPKILLFTNYKWKSLMCARYIGNQMK